MTDLKDDDVHEDDIHEDDAVNTSLKNGHGNDGKNDHDIDDE